MLPAAGFILIVEDDLSTAHLMALILRMEGFTVEVAHNCTEALKLCELQKPALVLLDYILDGEDCERLVENGTVGGAPTILVSAHNSARPAYERLHLTGFIRKPFSIESLTSLVKAIKA